MNSLRSSEPPHELKIVGSSLFNSRKNSASTLSVNFKQLAQLFVAYVHMYGKEKIRMYKAKLYIT
jgi:hypothetical protein